jgi:hypothetical protein
MDGALDIGGEAKAAPHFLQRDTFSLGHHGRECSNARGGSTGWNRVNSRNETGVAAASHNAGFWSPVFSAAYLPT